jgi:hypothetical protein
MEPQGGDIFLSQRAESLRGDESTLSKCQILFPLFLHRSLDIQYTKQQPLTAHFSAVPVNQTTAKPPRTARLLNAPTSHRPAPTSHSQWSSRSTEYTRRSRTCPPAATGSCRNSAGRAWASSRSESLRTLYCKWWGRWTCFGKKETASGICLT